jgi:two-component system cell cycle sensor histidine kinase/response regulator CckA
MVQNRILILFGCGTLMDSLSIQSVNTKIQQADYQSQKGQVIAALAGGIAHDFNNILTAVICQIELALMDPALAPQARESLNKALQSARRGAELNAKLLQFSRKTEIRPASVNLVNLAEETVFLLRRAIDRKIQIQIQAQDNPLWPAWVDEGQIMQALMNLCLNARDVMPAGGELSLTLANCQFAAKDARPPGRPGEFIKISVRDTGRGMSPEILDHLFEPYFTTKEFGKGAGLGLSIANHIVVGHGGWMEVESKVGEGSQFHIFLPRASMEPERTAVPLESIPGASQAVEGNETVLIVDDESPIRDVVRATLTFHGYQVIEASDGMDGIERFLAAKGRINIVLLDLQMPRMNGWETMKKVHGLNPRTPIILLSGGVSDPPDDGKALARSAGLMQKPFTSRDLLRMVRRVLDDFKAED